MSEDDLAQGARAWREMADCAGFRLLMNDRMGLDGIPCALLARLMKAYFPGSGAMIMKPDTGEAGRLDNVNDLMRMAVYGGEAIEVRVPKGSANASALKAALTALPYRHGYDERADPKLYLAAYEEASALIKECAGDRSLLMKRFGELLADRAHGAMFKEIEGAASDPAPSSK
jgi:hypothetical protein